jgi:hypothetical protein
VLDNGGCPQLRWLRRVRAPGLQLRSPNTLPFSSHCEITECTELKRDKDQDKDEEGLGSPQSSSFLGQMFSMQREAFITKGAMIKTQSDN